MAFQFTYDPEHDAVLESLRRQPLEQRLQFIRNYWESLRHDEGWLKKTDPICYDGMRHVTLLMEEIERLRAREALLTEIADAVAEGVSDSETGDCCFCGVIYREAHTPDCPVTKARALLAESEGQK